MQNRSLQKVGCVRTPPRKRSAAVRLSPVSHHYLFAFYVVALGSFDGISNVRVFINPEGKWK